MKYNRDLQLKELESKYYLLGFIIGIIPYIFIIGLAIILNVSNSFKEILFIFSLITGIINGIIFKNTLTKKDI